MANEKNLPKNISLCSLPACSPRQILFAANYDKKYIGLQLYTVRDHMQTDPAATLARVAQIGYNFGRRRDLHRQ